MKKHEGFNLSCNPLPNSGISCTISSDTLKDLDDTKGGRGNGMTIKELRSIVVKGFARMDEFIAQQTAFNNQQTEFNKLVANFIQEQLAHNRMMEKRVGNLEMTVKSLDNRVAKLETKVETIEEQVKNIKTILKKNNIK
ncbi:hypothetical protein CJJ23_01865 [Mycoplasmopsis agassizii]|uniref:Uncharacterized protein n=1 Tax=Mycoplasmopsis agassizii TaxID=33922 RepID=A0A269TJF4_9BACT|nr:hypothetical protein [Mycoplasmopsis agassizii]PAK21517.1 hypothetical protein CJJ23_01865 [Mycoplasmopsis agassizii]